MDLVIDDRRKFGQHVAAPRLNVEVVFYDFASLMITCSCRRGDLPKSRLLRQLTDAARDFDESAFGVGLGVVATK